MTALPDVDNLVSGTTQEGDFQAALSSLYNHIAETIGASEPEELEVSLGTISPIKGHVIIDTESLAATDDLTNIEAVNLGSRFLILQCLNSSRAVVLKHDQPGSGKLKLYNSVDCTLQHPSQMILFRYIPSLDEWTEVSRNFGLVVPSEGVASTIRSSLGLTSAALKTIGTGAGQIPTSDLLGALAFLSTITETQLAASSVTTAKIAAKAVDKTKMANGSANTLLGYDGSGVASTVTMGSNVWMSGSTLNASGGLTTISVGQGQIRTSVGSFSAWVTVTAPSTGVYLTTSSVNPIILPGGQYGFLPRATGVYNHTYGFTAWIAGIQEGNTAGVAIPFSTTAGYKNVYGDQRYVTSSPPFNLEGEVAGFLFMQFDKTGKLLSHYFADVPPWGYNGPTRVTADFIDARSGKKYKLKQDPNGRINELRAKKKGLNFKSSTRSMEDRVTEALQNQKRLEIEKNNGFIYLPETKQKEILTNKYYDKIKDDILRTDYEEITDEIKNKDMHLIPHPFGTDVEGTTTVLVGVYDDIIRDLIELQNDGEDIGAAIGAGYFYADNNLRTSTLRNVGFVDLKVR